MDPGCTLSRVPRASVCILLAIVCLSPRIVSESPGFVPKTSRFSEGGTYFDRRNSATVSIWRHLACITAHVYTLLHCVDGMGEDVTANHLLVVVFDASNTRLASHFMRTISQDRLYLQFISFQIGTDSSSSTKVSDIVDIITEFRNKGNSVIFFSDNVNYIVEVLEVVSLSEELRYTGVLHSTEWLIVLTVLVDEIPDVLLKWSRSVDFITLVYMPCINTTFIAQQSRTQNLTVKAKVVNYNIHPGQRIPDSGHWPGTSCGVLRSPKEILRKSARQFLKSQKSALEGMRLRAAVSRTIVGGNLTNIDKHAMELLKLLAMSLGFRWELVASKDTFTYGLLTGQANGTGISGVLARREAALTTMPLTMTVNRLTAVSFVPVRTFAEPYFIFYRWPHRREKVDLIYIYIMKPELMYGLIGAVLSAGIIGAIVHVVTRSCSWQLTEPLSALDIRRLSSCPSHICFRYPGTYTSHSGRILLASWAVLLVVLGAAFSAFLVTNFVIIEAPPIKSLQQLNANKDFTFGINGASDLTRFLLTNSTDPSVQTFSARLAQLNRSDPETTSSRAETHIQKILAGGYALVGTICVPNGLCDQYVPENITDLVFYQVEERKLYGECFVAVSKDAFFQQDLYNLLLQVQQLGILEFLQTKHLRSKLVNDAGISLKNAVYQTDSQNAKVGLLRILLVVYVSLAGIGVAAGCLLVELVVSRLLARNTM